MDAYARNRGTHSRHGSHGDFISSGHKHTSRSPKNSENAMSLNSTEAFSPVSKVLGRVLEHLQQPKNSNNPGKAYNASIVALSTAMATIEFSDPDREILSGIKARIESAYDSRDRGARNQKSREYTDVVKAIAVIYENKKGEFPSKNE